MQTTPIRHKAGTMLAPIRPARTHFSPALMRLKPAATSRANGTKHGSMYVTSLPRASEKNTSGTTIQRTSSDNVPGKTREKSLPRRERTAAGSRKIQGNATIGRSTT